MQKLIEQGLKLGLTNEGYHTVRNGGVSKYKGWAFVRENGTPYILQGYEPKGSPEYVTQQGGVSVYRLEGDQTDLEARVRQVEKTIAEHLQHAWDFQAGQDQPFVAFAWCQHHAGTPEYEEYSRLWKPVGFWRQKRDELLKRVASQRGLLVH